MFKTFWIMGVFVVIFISGVTIGSRLKPAQVSTRSANLATQQDSVTRARISSLTPIGGFSPQEAPQLSRACQAGNTEACARLQAFGMGFSNYAQLQQKKDEAVLTELCKRNKQDACETLKRLKNKAGS